MSVGLGCLVIGVASIAAIGCGRVLFDPTTGTQTAIDADIDADRSLLACSDRYADVIVCDDFDDAGFPGWNAVASSVVPSATSRGTEPALHASVPAGGGDSLLVRQLAPIASGRIYMRVLVEAPTTFTPTGFIVLVELHRSGVGKISMDLEGGDELQLYTPGQVLGLGPGTFPRGQWLCLEAEVELAAAGGAGYGRLSLDGAVAITLPMGIETTVAGGYDTIQIGASSAATNPAVEVNLDDLVLARSPVGCD